MASTFYFIGGEDSELTKSGQCTVDTATTAARRTTNARCSMKVVGSSTMGDSCNGTLSAPQSILWLTMRMYAASLQTFDVNDIVSLTDSSGVKRLVVRNTTGKWQLAKRNAAGTYTTLVNPGTGIPLNSVIKIDVFVNYAASGKAEVYVDGGLIMSYTGDVTTDSATSLAGFQLGCGGPSSQTIHWTEVICSDSDTRGMSLVTLAPNAAGNSFTFDTGSVSSINETTLDDSTLMSSGTAGQLAQFTVGSSGITGNPAIKAVTVSARAAKGGTGPQNVKGSIRTGGTNYLGAAIALPAGLGRVQAIFTTNPATSAPWAGSDLTAAGFNIGIQSEA